MTREHGDPDPHDISGTTPRGRGRPSHLTAERAECIVANLRAGVSLGQAAQHAGVGRRTLTRWLEQGTRQRTGHYHELAVAVRRAQRAYRRSQAPERGVEVYLQVLQHALRTGQRPSLRDIRVADRQTQQWLKRYLRTTQKDEVTQLRRVVAEQEAHTRAMLASLRATPPPPCELHPTTTPTTRAREDGHQHAGS